VHQSQLHIESRGPEQGLELVMLHGWGMNSAVFTPLHASLSQYRVHYVDLPGFGHSAAIEGDIDSWVDAIAEQLPNPAIWIGWSLGGLVATLAAVKYPQQVKALVTLASSPCFMARESESWPGISPEVLVLFGEQLDQNLRKTIERFLAIQAMGSPTAKGDIKALRELVLARPLPSIAALHQGLDMLKEVDLRPQLIQIRQPWLRIWGRLDTLVPKQVITRMPVGSQYQDSLLPKASHAPFISHKDEFVSLLLNWLTQFDDKPK